jgi:hypothetical protein
VQQVGECSMFSFNIDKIIFHKNDSRTHGARNYYSETIQLFQVLGEGRVAEQFYHMLPMLGSKTRPGIRTTTCIHFLVLGMITIFAEELNTVSH